MIWGVMLAMAMGGEPYRCNFEPVEKVVYHTHTVRKPTQWGASVKRRKRMIVYDRDCFGELREVERHWLEDGDEWPQPTQYRGRLRVIWIDGASNYNHERNQQETTVGVYRYWARQVWYWETEENQPAEN